MLTQSRRILFLAGLLLLLFGNRIVYPLDLELTTHLGDKQHFKTGDEIKLLVSLDQDAYLLLLYRDAQGGVSQLFPNPHAKHAYHKAGDFFPLPTQPARFRFIVGPPYGSEWFWLFAASQALPDLEGKNLASGPKQIPLSMAEIRRRLSTYAKENQFKLIEQSLKVITSRTSLP